VRRRPAQRGRSSSSAGSSAPALSHPQSPLSPSSSSRSHRNACARLHFNTPQHAHTSTHTQLDWPALVRAVVQALDDVGCRPRQFSAKQARAIRAAQSALGYHEALWEGWQVSAARTDSGGEGDALGALPGDFLRGLLQSLGMEAGDVAGSEGGGGGGGGGASGDEVWGAGEDVFVWSNGAGAAQGGAFAAGREERGGSAEVAAHAGERLASLPGVPLDGLALRDIHLVPVTGGDGSEGARTPYINVRAKCAPQKRQLHDRSPWGR